MAKFVSLIAGAALIGTGLFLEFVTFGASTPLTAFLISVGAGMVLTGIGTLLQKGPLSGTSTASRNPIAPWNVVYGRGKVGGTLVYFGSFADSDKYLDLVIVLACHPCRSVDALLFDGRRIQIDPVSGSSFTPLEQTVNIFHISRTNDVVTVVLHANIPLLQAGDDVIIQNVTGDRTLNGRYPVLQVISQVIGGPGSITFSYICGGAAAIVDLQGQVVTTWPDYRAKVHMEVLLGNHSATFPGMITGTPYDGDVGNLVLNANNPWGANHKLLGKTAVFLRLHYNDEVFGNGLPAISFHVSGKNDILDPRTSPVTAAYTENAALCIADYLSNRTWGFKASYGTEIPTAPLISAANLCDEGSPLAAGGTEPRYSLNGGFPLTMKRGEVLQNLLTSCAGRLTYSGGQFVIHPAGWSSVSLALDGTVGIGFGPSVAGGWTPRVSVHNEDGLDSFDAIATYPDSYSGTAAWPAVCFGVVTQAAIFALKTVGRYACVQGIGDSSSPGSFHSRALAFTANNTAGNCIVVDVAYQTAGAYVGVQNLHISDTQGNTYYRIVSGNVPFSPFAIVCFAAPDCAAGPNTVTVTQNAAASWPFFVDDFQSVSIAIHEYSGLSPLPPTGPFPSGVCDAGSYNAGAVFGHGTTVTAALVTSGSKDLLHFAASSVSYCSGVVASGDIHPPSPPLAALSVAAGPFRWRPKVSGRDLFNGVKGTHLCPGNKWQPSDIPPYAQDSLHGYASGSPLHPEGDANMAADGGDRRWLDIQLPFTISTSAAQRIAKIELMRRRQQGTGTFMFNMALYRTTALDVIQMSLPLLGWTDKLLEISAHRFKLDKVQTDGGEATLLGTEIDVQETDPSVYDWDPSEELSARGYQQAVLPSNVTPAVIPGPNTHEESLTDGFGNLIFENGDTISVLGVPN